MQNAGLDESQAGIKIAGKNINNPRYAIDTTLMTGGEDELKSLLISEGERREWKSWLKTQHSKMKVMASGPITSWQIEGEKMESSYKFYFPQLQNHYGWWLQPWH